MFVKYVVRDDLKSPDQTQELEEIEWETVAEMIRNLDGERHTYLIMYPTIEDRSEIFFGIRAARKDINVCIFYDGDVN